MEPVQVKMFEEPTAKKPTYVVRDAPSLLARMNEFLEGVEFVHATQGSVSDSHYQHNQLIAWTIYYREIKPATKKVFNVTTLTQEDSPMKGVMPLE